MRCAHDGSKSGHASEQYRSNWATCYEERHLPRRAATRPRDHGAMTAPEYGHTNQANPFTLKRHVQEKRPYHDLTKPHARGKSREEVATFMQEDDHEKYRNK